MNELELKYGCNPNQKPARIFMRDGSDLPITVLNGKPGYINFLDALNSWQLVRELKAATGLPAAASFKHVSPAGAAVGLPLSDVERQMYFVESDAGLSPIACAYIRRLRLYPGPGGGPAVLLRGLGGPLRRVRRRHRPVSEAGGVRRHHRPRLHRRGPGNPENQEEGQLQCGAGRPGLCPRSPGVQGRVRRHLPAGAEQL